MLVQLENIPGATSSSVLPYIVHFVLYNIGFKYIYIYIYIKPNYQA